MAKVLVTGATGFIGARIARQLCEAGEAVKVLARPTASLAHLKGLPVDVVHGDITVGHTVYRALAGCDRLFHVAAVYKMWDRDPERVLRPSIDGTREVLEAVRRREGEIRKVVVTSSVAAIGMTREPVEMDEQSKWKLDDSEPHIVAKRRPAKVPRSVRNQPPRVVG